MPRFQTVYAYDVPDSWRKVVAAIRKDGDKFKVNVGSETTETLKLALAVVIRFPNVRPLVDDKCQTTNTAKVQEYALRYLWTDSKTPDEEYTYGSRIRSPVDQVQKAIELLAKEPNNRQVTLTVRLPSDINSPHPPCLTVIDLEVLEGRLNLYGYFRSWDAFAGYPENTAGLQLFNEALVNEINEVNGGSLVSGELILFSKNCHLYERQYDWADRLAESGKDSRRMVKEVGTP